MVECLLSLHLSSGFCPQRCIKLDVVVYAFDLGSKGRRIRCAKLSSTPAQETGHPIFQNKREGAGRNGLVAKTLATKAPVD